MAGALAARCCSWLRCQFVIRSSTSASRRLLAIAIPQRRRVPTGWDSPRWLKVGGHSGETGHRATGQLMVAASNEARSPIAPALRGVWILAI